MKNATLRVTIISIITILLLQLPYLLGYLTTPDDQFYTGLIMNPEDSQTYWAKMTQGFNGAWAYKIPFTTEPHEAAYVGVFYVWLGQLAQVMGWSLTAVWHGSRMVAAAVLFPTVYWFITLFFRKKSNNQQSTTNNQQSTKQTIHNSQFTIHNSQLINGRFLAFLLAIFGSGLGWVLFLLGQPYWLGAFPVDFKQPGAHLFFTAMTFPHITLGTAFILISIGMMKMLGERNCQLSIVNCQLSILFGFSNLLLAIAYPFLIYIVAGTAVFYTLHLIWQRRAIPWTFGILTAVAFLIPAPLYLYYANVLRVNDVFRAWDVQAITPSAPWPHYLIAFGPYLLLMIVHWRNRHKDQSSTVILYCWVLTVLLLLYAPLNPQRRFVQGVQVPLAILSTLAITQTILPWLIQTNRWQRIVAMPRYETKRLVRLLAVLFLLLISLSNIYLWADVVRTAVLVQPDPLFRQAGELAATDWLREKSNSNRAVLGEMQTGNLVAAQTGKPVFIGHWAETVDYEQKQTQLEQFFDPATSDAWRQELLNTHQITHLWHGPREMALGSFDPSAVDYLTAVYQTSSITLYRVSLPSN